VEYARERLEAVVAHAPKAEQGAGADAGAAKPK
jgi:hypothetical protein